MTESTKDTLPPLLVSLYTPWQNPKYGLSASERTPSAAVKQGRFCLYSSRERDCHNICPDMAQLFFELTAQINPNKIELCPAIVTYFPFNLSRQ